MLVPPPPPWARTKEGMGLLVGPKYRVDPPPPWALSILVFEEQSLAFPSLLDLLAP